MSLKRRAWLTLGAVVLGGGGVVTYAVASPSDHSEASGRSKRPVKVYDVGLKSAAGDRRELARTGTAQFSMLGVSWTGAAKRLDGTAQVRTRSLTSGEWSAWHDLDVDVDPLDRPEPGVRGASEPLWVGPSDGVQVQVVRKNGTTSTSLPKGMEVNLVDPGVVTAAEAKVDAPEPAAFVADETPDPTDTASTESTDSASPTDSATSTPTDSQTTASAEPTDTTTSATPTDSGSPSATPSTTPSPTATVPTAPSSTVPEPPITSRVGWGADESISPEAPEYNADVKAVFVHHTDGANDYSCTADSASIVRAIYAYHVQVSGWKDMGYNFLVDKCGTIFEGRKGGVDLPVFGAHTYGWNREAAGVAVLGDYTTASPSSAALASVARLAAWKLGQYGADPAGTVQLTSGATQKNFSGTAFTAGTKYTFQRISGHRDGYNTLCPGGLLYDQLPTIRAWAAGPVQGLKVASVSGATLSGSTYYTKGAITARWSTTTPGTLISRTELLVDGKIAATAAGTATSASATLAAGSHTVAVRAVHQSGKATTTAALTVVADTAAPTFTTAPKLSLRTGVVTATAVPVTLGWKAVDDKALREVRLLAPTTATFGPTVTASSRTAKPGAAATWSMQAYDYAGNYRASSASYTPAILQETSAAKSGAWTARSSTSYLGGKSYSSAAKGASLTWTFTGRSAAWVVSRAATSGQAYVYVDGAKVATVDLKSATTLYRQAVWTKTWSTAAKHTVKIVVVGTAGRPTVTTDGLVHIK